MGASMKRVFHELIGALGQPAIESDNLPTGERDRVAAYVWHSIIVPELNEIRTQLFPSEPSANLTSEDTWERQREMQAATREWAKRQPALRYIGGYFYHLDLSVDPLDMVTTESLHFERYRPEAIATVVESLCDQYDDHRRESHVRLRVRGAALTVVYVAVFLLGLVSAFWPDKAGTLSLVALAVVGITVVAASVVESRRAQGVRRTAG